MTDRLSGEEAPGKSTTADESAEKDQQAKPRHADWKAIEDELIGRSALFVSAYNRLEKYVEDRELRFWLAATDAFVEKAQFRLGFRARVLAFAGGLAAVLALLLLTCTAWVIYRSDPTLPLGPTPDGYRLTLLVLKSLTVGGLIGGAAYLLAALSKALLHESSVLFTRRHSLRFGRLAIYLHKASIDAETLMKVFRWSDEFSSAFLGINDEGVKGGPGRVAEQTPQVLNGVANIVAAAKGGGGPAK